MKIECIACRKAYIKTVLPIDPDREPARLRTKHHHLRADGSLKTSPAVTLYASAFRELACPRCGAMNRISIKWSATREEGE